MHSVNPKIIVLFIAVIIGVVALKFSNPHKAYSTQNYWQTATAESVYEVPQAALAPGNKNGPVLMWAAMTANDPKIITRLVNRGANPNEADLLGGTPLTGASAYNSNPQIIRALVKMGADVNQTVNFDDSPLIVAAHYAKNAAVIEMLIELGADPAHKNVRGRDALAFARHYNNDMAVQVLSEYAQDEDERMQTAAISENGDSEEVVAAKLKAKLESDKRKLIKSVLKSALGQ